MEQLSSCPVCGNLQYSLFMHSRDFFLTGEEYTIVSCNSCGMKFVNPRPDSVEISKYYESSEYISHDTVKKTSLNILYKWARSFSVNRKYKLTAANARGKKLLDIGCGTGEFIHFCKVKGFEVKGIEPEEKPRFFAQTKYHLDVSGEDFLDKSIQPEFDVITLWHVLEHVHELQKRMDKIAQIMKPDGTLIIAVPNCESWDACFYGKFWAAYDLPRHLYHFTRETMEILAKKHGLKIENVIPMKLDAYYISLLSEKYANGKQNYFRAVINGIRSNNYAGLNNMNYSSLIYVIKNEKQGIL